ncbi:MAG: hypothetical protein ACI81R_001288 [Bradymonadia bacterium]|jgi:hypothetical protein
MSYDADGADYFVPRKQQDVWDMGGTPLQVEYVVRPLSAIFDALAEAGWRDVHVHEPEPLRSARASRRNSEPRCAHGPGFCS